jgi:hypothetical protein
MPSLKSNSNEAGHVAQRLHRPWAAVSAAPALAVEFAPSPGGYIEFTMPSNNIGCIYRDEEGSGLVLECDRVAPSYLRVRLFQDGKPKVYRNVGDASCCGATNYFD